MLYRNDSSQNIILILLKFTNTFSVFEDKSLADKAVAAVEKQVHSGELDEATKASAVHMEETTSNIPRNRF